MSLERLNAALADRYRVERELGAGGMATVYLAHDLRHRRPVAIKVLRPDLARSLAGDRFLREIAITARLNHPHILALLDSGSTADGEILYYVMPVAAGQSLRDRLAACGALPPADATRIACDAGEALVHAQAHGYPAPGFRAHTSIEHGLRGAIRFCSLPSSGRSIRNQYRCVSFTSSGGLLRCMDHRPSCGSPPRMVCSTSDLPPGFPMH